MAFILNVKTKMAGIGQKQTQLLRKMFLENFISNQRTPKIENRRKQTEII